MNTEQAELWKSDVLDRVLLAVATSMDLRHAIAFKGARVLALRLSRSHRRSLDLDGTLEPSFAEAHPDHADRCRFLEAAFTRCLRDAFEQDAVVRYTLVSVRVGPKPRKGHPLGWTAYDVRMQIRDARHAHVRVMPAVEIDVAAPETLSELAVSTLVLGERTPAPRTRERPTSPRTWRLTRRGHGFAPWSCS